MRVSQLAKWLLVACRRLAAEPPPGLLARLIAAHEFGHTALPLDPDAALQPTDGARDGASNGADSVLETFAGHAQLARFAVLERQVAHRLCELALAPQEAVANLAQMVAAQTELYASDGTLNAQALAIAVALSQPLAVIHGGPGTGKTTTLYWLLQACEQRFGKDFRIALAAPTGKAATRMLDAISARAQVSGRPLANLIHAATLHRLLGYRPWRRWRHDANHPLPWDMVIIDEASMLDLELFARLLSALPKHARLVLVGDPDQLPPVAPGSILPEILANASVTSTRRSALELAVFPRARRSQHAPLLRPTMADCAVALTRAHRFAAGEALGAFALCVRAGDSDAVIAGLQAGRWPGVQWLPPSEQILHEHLMLRIAEYRALACAPDPQQALAAAARSQWLCALRRGPAGVEALNRWSDHELAEAGQSWFHGRVVMVRANVPQLGLYNGDLGVVWRTPDGSSRVYFMQVQSAQGQAGQSFGMQSFAPQSFEPDELPHVESAFAMTVHQAQGSEFEQVTLWFDHHADAVLTREWLYTGVTRARKSVRIYASEQAIRMAMARKVVRHSTLGLRMAQECRDRLAES